MEGNNDWTNAQFRRIASSDAVKKNELSWNEQRAFNVRAIIALNPLPQMQLDFVAAVAATFPLPPALAGYAPLHLREGQLFTTPTLAFAFDPNTGAMNYLITLSDRRVWASAENPIAFFHYTTFSGAHMLKFQAEYNMYATLACSLRDADRLFTGVRLTAMCPVRISSAILRLHP